MKRTLRTIAKGTAIAIVLLMLALWGFVRSQGVLIARYDGKHTGYSKPDGVWLWNAYRPIAPRRDGPYVFHDNGRTALTVQPRAGKEAAVVRKAVGTEIEVVVDDPSRTRFIVPLRDTHPRPALQWRMPERLLAVSDLEGEFVAATTLLRAQGVIDENLNWRFGTGHVVLLGDMVDRGDNVVPLLWLIYKLEAEAEAAGGALHYVLGNHEQYLLQGRPKSAHEKYIGTARAAAMDYGALWSSQTELGRWLRSKPIMVKVGETLFVHGGVSPEVLSLGLDLEAIDKLAARDIGAMRARETAEDEPVLGAAGLLWYRGLAMATDKTPKASIDHVARVLAHFGVSRVAIGHTLATHVGHDYGGRVLRTDVAHAEGTVEGLLLEDGKAWRVDAAGLRIPVTAAVNL